MPSSSWTRILATAAGRIKPNEETSDLAHKKSLSAVFAAGEIRRLPAEGWGSIEWSTPGASLWSPVPLQWALNLPQGKQKYKKEQILS